MNTETTAETTAKRNVVPDVVCTGCGCLCDDISIEIEGGRIVEAGNACPMGRERFLADPSADEPPCLVDGNAATIEEGIERAARILMESRSPLIMGLGEATTEAQRAAISLADRIGAIVDSSNGGSAATVGALQTVGEVTCTLGEIRNRADLVVVWRADPLATHPRLFSRYALDPAGLFIPNGRPDRYCVILDVTETASARVAADQFVRLGAGRELEAIWILRALTAGIDIEAGEAQARTGIPLTIWNGLVDRMRSARYGVLFYGGAEADSEAGPLIAQGLHALTRDLNATTRFVCMPLPGGAGNPVGAANALAWSTGYPGAVSLSGGYPRYGPGELTTDRVLRKKEADAALVVSGDPVSALSAAAAAHLRRIPSVVMASDRLNPGGLEPQVAFRTAVLDIHMSGTVYRMDGVPLPVRRLLPTARPFDYRILRAIESRIRSLGIIAGLPERSD